MQYEQAATPEAILQEHQQWDALYGERVLPPAPLTVRTRQNGQPLRVGFLSSDFGRHPTGFLVLPALEQFGRTACQVVCYSDRTKEDEFTARFSRGGVQLASHLWSIR